MTTNMTLVIMVLELATLKKLGRRAAFVDLVFRGCKFFKTITINMSLIILVSQVATLKKFGTSSYACHLGLEGKYIAKKNQNDELQFIILVHKATLIEKKPR